MRLWLKTAAPDLARGVRAALATVVPFALASALDRPELVWVALGGWMGSIADPGGQRGARALVIGAFASLGGLLVLLAGLAQGVSWLPLLTLAAAAFATSLLRALGGGAVGLGTALLVTTCIASGGHITVPLRDGLAFALGASWAVLLSSVVWPIWTHLPVRRAIAAIFGALAGYATALEALAREDAPAHDPRWTLLARTHRLAVRLALEEARTTALALRQRRQGESRTGGTLRALLGDAEIEFFALIDLSENLERLGGAEDRDDLPALEVRAALVKALATFARDCRNIQERLVSRSLAVSTAPLQERAPSLPSGASGRLLRASRAALSTAGAPEDAAGAVSLGFRARLVLLRRTLRRGAGLLRDALSPRSPFLHHALRVTATVIVAALVGRSVSPEHVPWVTVTAVVVLQPYPGATVRRAIERMIGTVLGSATAAGLMLIIHRPLWQVLIMFPLSVAAVVTKPRSYRLFTFFVTPVFVLFADHWRGDLWTAVARVGDATVGGAIALVAAIAITPSWERQRLGDALVTVVQALARHAANMFDALAVEPDLVFGEAMVRGRRAVGVAVAEAETCFERMLAEPLHARTVATQAMQLMTYARQLSGALTALGSRSLPGQAPVADTEAVAATRAYVTAVLGSITAWPLPETATPPPAPPLLADTVPPDLADALARVIRGAQRIATLAAPDRADALTPP